jgi:lysophospholipase L1-like esterase
MKTGMRRTSIAGLLGLALALVAATAAVVAASGAADTPIARSAPAPVSTPVLTLVALGDSYSSGEGNGPYNDVGSRMKSCHNSPKAWPNLLDGVPEGPAVTLQRSFACTGASIAQLYGAWPETGQDSQLGQLDSLSDSPPTFVTITIGGNDVGFSDILTGCYVAGPPFSSTCSASGILRAAGDYVTGVLRRRLVHAYEAVKAHALGAQVVVVGYPRLFPTMGHPIDNCGWLQGKERSGVNNLVAAADSVMTSAAQEAGVEYVSVLDALEGHELCTEDSWMNPIRFGLFSEGHPSFRGQDAIANIVNSHLRRFFPGL